MKNTEIRNNSILVKIGWGILLATCALVSLNGVLWFFFGPQQAVAFLQEFGQVNPIIAQQMETNARQVAIWYLAFGLLALLVTLEGLRRRSRRAWYAMWILIPLLAALGVLYVDGFGVGLIGLAALALVGQLLAGKGIFAKASEQV